MHTATRAVWRVLGVFSSNAMRAAIRRRWSVVVFFAVLCVMGGGFLARPPRRDLADELIYRWGLGQVVWFGDSTAPSSSARKIREVFGERVVLISEPGADAGVWVHYLRFLADEQPDSFKGKTVILTLNVKFLSHGMQDYRVHFEAEDRAALLDANPLMRAERRLTQYLRDDGANDISFGDYIWDVYMGEPPREPLDELRSCAVLCRELNARCIVYSTPIEYEWCRSKLGVEFDEVAAHRLDLARRALEDTGAEFVDLTFLLDDTQFAHDHKFPTGHMTPEGRVAVIRRLGDAYERKGDE